MKNKTNLYTGLFLIIFGIFSVIFGAFLQQQIFNKESDAPFIFGIVFIIMGIREIIKYRKSQPKE